ncbi:hypothetical protein V8F20_010666 [Naviculisporaceae sp. PSN 640]
MADNPEQNQGQGEALPQEGDQVQWKWGSGHPQGTVSQTASTGDITIETQRGNTVKKNADPENPALLITRESGQDVVKRASEVEVIATEDRNDTAQAEATEEGQGGGGTSRKRKEQASTPTKKSESGQRGRPTKDWNSAKKVRTGKEGDYIASDHEDDEDYEQQHIHEDPEETEDEKEKDQAAKVKEGDDTGKERAATGTGEGTKEPESEAAAAAPADANNETETYNLFGSPLQSHPVTTSRNTTSNAKAKGRSQSASASPGGAGLLARNDGEKKPERRSSINEILNEEGESDNNNDNLEQGHENSPRQAKEVAEKKIAEIVAGKEARSATPQAAEGAQAGTEGHLVAAEDVNDH